MSKLIISKNRSTSFSHSLLLGNISKIESSKVALESRQSMIYENFIHLSLDKMQYVEDFNKSLIFMNYLYITYKHKIKFKVLVKCSK